MNLLIIGASVSALSFGGTSPGHLLAERWNAPVAVYAHAGRMLSEVLPPDEVIREAGLVVAVDAMYWGSNKWPCDEEAAALSRLLDVRDGRPMILGTVPEGEGWSTGRCTARFNATMRERCRGLCVLLELNGESAPPGLHPDRAYMERVTRKVVK